MLLLAGQGYHCARQAVLDTAAERLAELTESRRQRLEMWLSERLADAAFLAACPAVRHECSADSQTSQTAQVTSAFLSTFATKYGMYEAIGLKNIPAYMRKIRSLLAEDGLFLNHAISRKGKRKKSVLPERLRPEQRALAKYIFPGGALDDIGNTVSEMEIAGFEVHDVEGWRMHYARTCELWCERLMARKDEAIALVGEAKYRIYVAYLAGCAIVFERGTARLFQTLVSKTAKRRPPLPPTRADLYC